MKPLMGAFLVIGGLGVLLATLMFVLSPPQDRSQGGPDRAGDPVCIVPWAALAHEARMNANGSVERMPTHAVAELQSRNVMLEGFMIPLDAGHAHLHFKLSASPQRCPQCQGSRPDGWVEVIGKLPVEETDDQIVVAGRFSVLLDSEKAPRYRLTDAVRLVTWQP